MTIKEADIMIHDLKVQAQDLIHDKLQSVIDGKYTLYNTVSESFVPVDDDNIDRMIELYLELLDGHGIKHLIFIKQQEQSQ